MIVKKNKIKWPFLRVTFSLLENESVQSEVTHAPRHRGPGASNQAPPFGIPLHIIRGKVSIAA